MTGAIDFIFSAKNETGGAIASVKDEVRGAGQAADEAGGHFAGLKEHLGKVAEVAAGMLGAEAAGGLANMFRGTMSAANDLGSSVFALQQRIGGTAQDSSRLLFAFQEMGVQNPDRAIQSFSKSLQGLEEQADGTTVKSSKVTDQLKAMGVQVEDATGKQRSMNDVMGDVADRFQHMPDGPEKTALALQLFGKAGADMIPMLDKGRAGMAALGEESDKLGHTLTDKQVAAMRSNTLETEKLHAATEGLRIQFGVALLPAVTSGTELLTKLATAVVEHAIPAFQHITDELQTHLAPVIKADVLPLINQVISLFQTLTGGPIGMLITGVQLLISHWGDLTKQFPALGQVIDQVQPKLQQVADWLGKNIGAAIAQVVPMMQQFGNILAQNVAPILQTIFQWLGGHEQVLMAIVGTAGIVGLVATIGAIPVAIVAITAAVVALVTHWGEITKAVGDFVDSIETRFPEVGKFISQAQVFFTGLWTFITTQFVPDIVAGVQAIVDFIRDHWAGISDLLSGPIMIAKAVITGILTTIRDTFELLFTQLGDVLQIAGDLFKGNWGKLWGDVEQLIGDTFSGILKIVGDQLHEIEGILTGEWQTIKSAATQAWNEISGVVQDALHALWQWIKSNWVDILLDLLLGPVYMFRDQIGGVIEAAGKAVATALGDIKDTIVGWAKDAATWLISAGESIITGLVQGFTNKFDDIKNTLGGLKDKIVGWKGPPEDDAVLLVNNGQLIIQGLQAGMESQYPAVQASLQTFGQGLVSTIQGTVSAIGQQLATATTAISNFANRVASIGTGGASSGGGGTYSVADIARLVLQAGATPGEAATLAAIGEAESGGSPTAGSAAGAYGLFQFMPATAAAMGLGDRSDPVASARAALALARSMGYSQWDAYSYVGGGDPNVNYGEVFAGAGAGSYTQFLAAAQAAVGNIAGPGPGAGLGQYQGALHGGSVTAAAGTPPATVVINIDGKGQSLATDRTATGELVRAISKYLVSIGQPALVPGAR